MFICKKISDEINNADKSIIKTRTTPNGTIKFDLCPSDLMKNLKENNLIDKDGETVNFNYFNNMKTATVLLSTIRNYIKI